MCSSDLLREVEAFVKEHNIIPSLHVILVGDHPSSQIYVRNKQKACQIVGIRSVLHQLPAVVSQLEVDELNKQLRKEYRDKLNKVVNAWKQDLLFTYHHYPIELLEKLPNKMEWSVILKRKDLTHLVNCLGSLLFLVDYC